MNTFKVGLVGAGQICEFHIKALKRIPGTTILGITDLDQGRAHAVCEQWNILRVYPSVRELCEAVDVVHVLTPPKSHAEITLTALAEGCHVYVEKPLATSCKECDEISYAAQAAGRSVCVGHSLMRDPFVTRALEAARSGIIGKPITVDYFRCQGYPPYTGGPLPVAYRDGGYPFRDLGIHALYLIEAFLGKIGLASGRFFASGREPHLHFDEWRVHVECEHGTGQIQLSWNVRPQQNLLIVQGTQGILRVDLFGMSVTRRRCGRLPEHAQRVMNSVSEGFGIAAQPVVNTVRFLTGRLRQFHGLQGLVADFYDSLQRKQPSPIPPDTVASVVHWTEEIARSADRAKSAYLFRFSPPYKNSVLVTGAAGFIGRRLVSRLLHEGQPVRVLVRREPPQELWPDCKPEIVLGDLGDPEAVDRAVSGVTTIYHLGAAMRGSVHDFDRGTVVGTRNIVDAALKYRVSKFLYLSSLSVLHAAATSSNTPITEGWPLEPHPALRGHYSRTKLEAERYITDAVKTRNLPAVVLRPAEVIGPDGPQLTAGIAQRVAARLVLFGQGTLGVPMVQIDDLVDAIRLAEQGQFFDGTIFHIVDPFVPTQNELIERYLARTGKLLKVVHLPRALAYSLAAILQVLAGGLGKSSSLSIYRLRSALAARTFDCSMATDRLRWHPRAGVRTQLQQLSTEEADQMARERAVSRMCLTYPEP